MSKIKSLILGSAAMLAAASGAQAADLPVKAKAVQYVKICSLYGAGFYYIPGTDTCIKLGGYAQLDVTINGTAHHQPAWNNSGSTGLDNRASDRFVTRARTSLNIDTRTATEYGVVRTYWSSNFQHTSGDGPSSGVLTMDFGFIQFAGFTLGKAISAFQTPWGGSPVGLNTSNLIGGYDNATGINQIAYTWQFGNGVSAQVGIEDNRVINRAPLFNGGALITGGSAATTAGAYLGAGTLASNQNGTGGNVSPDFVGNVRIDQAAFTAQVSGGLHNIHGTYYTSAGALGNELNGGPSDAWGFAVAGGLQLKNLPTGRGDKLSLEATYTDGAPKYVIGGTTGNTFDHFGGSTDFAGSYQSFASLNLYDGVFGTGGGIEKTKAWGFRGGYEHNWSPNWQTTVFGSYTHIDYNANASALICGAQLQAIGMLTGGATANGYSCNPDFNIWQVGSRTAWTPVRNLTFSGEIMYTMLDQSNSGSVTTTGAALIGGFKPAGTYDYKDQGILSGNLRVRRTW
jgi:hypothetical protein